MFTEGEGPPPQSPICCVYTLDYLTRYLVFSFMCVSIHVSMSQTTLAEQHVERIRNLESALRQRETSIQKLSAQLRSKDTRPSQIHTSLDVPGGRFCLDHGSIIIMQDEIQS